MSRLFELNPKRYAAMPVEEGIVEGLWYLICSEDCSPNYHMNFYAMGNKLWCLGVNYKPVANGKLLQETIVHILTCKRLSDKFREEVSLTKREIELGMEYNQKVIKLIWDANENKQSEQTKEDTT